MSQINATFAIVVLLSFSQLHDVNAVLKYMEQSYSYPKKQVMYNEYSFKEGNLVYAVCHGTSVQKNCTVVQRQFSNDLQLVTRSCNLTLKVRHPEKFNLTDKVTVLAFGQERAILFWGEIGLQGSLHLMIMQMDDCKMKDTIMNDTHQSLYLQQISTHKVIVYDTSFDMFFDIQPVKMQGMRRVRVDQDFNLDFDNVTKKEDGAIRYISPIATRSPDKGYVYSTLKNLWLVKPDGSHKLLTNQENQLGGVSAGYNAITSCAKPEMDSQTTCTQYDEDGKVKFKVTLEYGYKRAVMWQAVHNTPQGGFLLMTTSLKMSGGDEANSNTKPSNCEIVRVNGEGNRVGSIRLKGCFERLQNANTQSIWENKDQFCVASIGHVGHNSSPADNLNVAVNCFTEVDFVA